jgi:hypothetical protein
MLLLAFVEGSLVQVKEQMFGKDLPGYRGMFWRGFLCFKVLLLGILLLLEVGLDLVEGFEDLVYRQDVLDNYLLVAFL